MLKENEEKRIIEYVKKEPRTVQDISRLISRSWVTTDTYLAQLKERTGIIDIKTFRKGTQAALKIVFYSSPDNVRSDEIKERIYHTIQVGREKEDFDFMDIFQYVKKEKKKAFMEEYTDPFTSTNQRITSLFLEAQSIVYCFSGNLSFINIVEKKKRMIDVMEELLKRKVRFKIVTRVNLASVHNIEKLSFLLEKYSDLIEIKHSYQPLRGFIIDDKIARFKEELETRKYKADELHKNSRVFYEIYDSEWVLWMQKVFWNLFRVSIDYKERLKDLKRIF